MEVGRLYLDANILILIGEGRDETTSLLTELVTTRTDFVTSELTLAELLVKPYRDGDEALVRRYEDWMFLGGFMEAAPVETSTLRHAALIRARYRTVKLPDAIHLATAIGHGCGHMLSGDTRLPDRIELHDSRWGVAKKPVALDVIRPEASVLRNILEAKAKS
jgi:predicted nucleic acid-binding protein